MKPFQSCRWRAAAITNHSQLSTLLATSRYNHEFQLLGAFEKSLSCYYHPCDDRGVLLGFVN